MARHQRLKQLVILLSHPLAGRIRSPADVIQESPTGWYFLALQAKDHGQTALADEFDLDTWRMPCSFTACIPAPMASLTSSLSIRARLRRFSTRPAAPKVCCSGMASPRISSTTTVHLIAAG